MAVAHLTPKRYRSAPWRNGLGVSREVARGAGGDGGASWLVSLTTIAADCPFSDYRGYDRILTPLGDGVVLTVGGAAPVPLARLQPFAFAGDAQVDCRLAAGPAEVVNAMVARDWGSQSVTLLQAAPARFAIAAPVAVLHALGKATVTVAGAAFALAVGDSLRVDDMAGAEAVIAAASETPLYLATFQPHR
jgi:environmental stress-induced protein Ves